MRNCLNHSKCALQSDCSYSGAIMKLFTGCIAVLGLLAMVQAKPLDDPRTAQIISYESDNIGIDGYRFAYETSDGIKRTEEATLKNPGTENEAISIRGTISWVGADGQTYTINFIADENGFQPEGAHLPKK